MNWVNRIGVAWRVKQMYGVAASLEIAAALVLRRRVVTFRPVQLKCPITIRWRSSDRLVLEQILVRRESMVEKLADPQFIVDLGANVGCSSALYASSFPRATVIAVEPASDNLVLARENLGRYRNATVIPRCAWFEDATLEFENPTGEAWAYRFGVAEIAAKGGGGSVGTVTIPQLLQRAPESGIDLLKIDVEGAEFEIFSKGARGWFDRVRWILVEPHDRFKPGCSEVIRAALAATHVERAPSGEFLVFERR